MTPELIAVIGPVEPDLLATWLRHYRRLGIESFRLAFHFPDYVSHERCDDLLVACRYLGVTPAQISTGPWHEHTNALLRDALREAAGSSWHLLADVDEFHTYPAPVLEVIATVEASKRSVVGGLFLDRVADDGRLAAWLPQTGLDRAFPLGGHLTHRLLHGDPRKIVLARSTVTVASGNHRAPGHQPDRDILAAVHHFKWRAGVIDDLRRRVERFSCGDWVEHTSAVRDEASRLLDHVARHRWRIDVADPRLAFRRVTLDVMPIGWAEEAATITSSWRPSAARGAIRR